MQYYECKCGHSQAFGSMPPARCEECPDCHTKLLHVAYKINATDNDWKPQEHTWKTQYDVDTGIKYERCVYCDKRRD